MGYFSWYYADKTKRRMLIGKPVESYLLVPEPFQSVYGYGIPTYYDGYGHFGAFKVYVLIARWNKEFIPTVLKHITNREWKCSTNDRDVALLERYHAGEDVTADEEDWIGIILSCYDEDNARLPYPIKITTKLCPYDSVSYSKRDPGQGCR